MPYTIFFQALFYRKLTTFPKLIFQGGMFCPSWIINFAENLWLNRSMFCCPFLSTSLSLHIASMINQGTAVVVKCQHKCSPQTKYFIEGCSKSAHQTLYQWFIVQRQGVSIFSNNHPGDVDCAKSHHNLVMKSCYNSEVPPSQQNISCESDYTLGPFYHSTSVPIYMTWIITPGWAENHWNRTGDKSE